MLDLGKTKSEVKSRSISRVMCGSLESPVFGLFSALDSVHRWTEASSMVQTHVIKRGKINILFV